MAKIIILKKKQLTPSALGFTMQPVDAVTLLKRVNLALEKMRKNETMSNGVFEVCNTILQHSNKGKEQFNVNFASWVSPQEVGIITSDFGEISGALYMLRYSGTPYAKVKFPTIANEKLIDYILVGKDGLDYPFSAKAGAGGKPSITAVLPAIRSMKLSGKMKKAAEVMAAIGIEEKTDRGTSTGTDLFKGPLLAANLLGKEIPAYEELIKVLKNPKLKTGYTGGVPTSEHLDTAVANAGLYPVCADTHFKTFLSAAKRLGFELKDETSVKRAINLSPYGLPGGKPHRDKRWGLLHYPITANLISWLNKKENGATALLSKAANTSAVTQIYFDSTATSVKYTVKKFSDAEFEFGSPSSTPNPVGNRIGLTMLKSPKISRS